MLDLEPRFGFRSPAMTVELQRLEQPTVPVRDNYLLDNYLYLLRRLPTAIKNAGAGEDFRTSLQQVSRDLGPKRAGEYSKARRISEVGGRHGIQYLRAGETSYEDAELPPETVAAVRKFLKDTAIHQKDRSLKE